MKGGGSGLLRELITGLIGDTIGSRLIPKPGIVPEGGCPGAIASAFIGAAVVLLCRPVRGEVTRRTFTSPLPL